MEASEDRNNLQICRTETKPLQSLEDLLRWIPDNSSGCPASVALPEHNAWNRNVNSRRTILCHDMKGGYLADRFVNGCRVVADDPYYFYHWSQIHAFIYFSHNLVTIPPTSWMNAAHRNQVPILGTFITEWDDGKAIWKRLFSDEKLLKLAATILVEIAFFYGIDGWFVNIENSIEPENIDQVITFLRYLRQGTRINPADKMKHLIVIWYDSVTIKGDLVWQNALNDDNMKFFHFVDGIFLNYNWTLKNLEASKKMAGLYRKYDVFVGVDIFGRGCYGGGGWNTCKALEVIKSLDMSIAIFAPGWVLECNPASSFKENQEKFWDSISHLIPSHPLYSFPIKSNFCVGYGKTVFSNGEVESGCKESDGPETHWFDLSKQSLQPCRIPDDCGASESRLHLLDMIFHEDCWMGGGCLAVLLPADVSKRRILLFKTEVELTKDLHVDLTIRLPKVSRPHCGLIISVQDNLKAKQIWLACQSGRPSDEPESRSIPAFKVHEVSSISDGHSWFTFQFVLRKNDHFQDKSVMNAIYFTVEREDLSASERRILLGEISLS